MQYSGLILCSPFHARKRYDNSEVKSEVQRSGKAAAERIEHREMKQQAGSSKAALMVHSVGISRSGII